MVFTESAAFSRKVYGILSEDELIALEYRLLLSPDAGDLIPGAAACAKSVWLPGVKESAADRG